MYGINLNELSFGFYEKFTCRDLDFDLQILDDFLHDRELFKYDNRGGRCEVTHRPTVQGTNPWMVDILEGQGNDDYTSFVKALKFLKTAKLTNTKTATRSIMKITTKAGDGMTLLIRTICRINKKEEKMKKKNSADVLFCCLWQ